MTILNDKDSVVLVIDIQDKLLNAVFNKEKVLNNSMNIVKSANILDIPILITEQYPKGLGNTNINILDATKNNAKVFEKVTFSALDNKDLAETLKNIKRTQIIIFGIETHICVSQTASALVELGYNVTVIKDACGSRKEEEYFAGLERMKEHGVHTATTEIALFEWLKTAKNTRFKEIQALIK